MADDCVARTKASVSLQWTFAGEKILNSNIFNTHFSPLKVQDYMGDIVAVLILGAVLYLAIETPIMKIEKYFSSGNREREN